MISFDIRFLVDREESLSAWQSKKVVNVARMAVDLCQFTFSSEQTLVLVGYGADRDDVGEEPSGFNHEAAVGYILGAMEASW